MSSHHDWIIEISAQHDALKPFAPENGQPLRFGIGVLATAQIRSYLTVR